MGRRHWKLPEKNRKKEKLLIVNLINVPDSLPEVLEKDLVSIREVLVALQGEREKNASELTRMLDEREGLQEYIARLEEANRSVCERHPFPREAVRDIFRRMNPKVENLKKEEVLTLLEALWNRNVVSREEER